MKEIIKLMFQDFIELGFIRKIFIFIGVLIVLTLIFPFNIWVLNNVYQHIPVINKIYTSYQSTMKGESLLHHFAIIPEMIENSSSILLLFIALPTLGLLTSAIVYSPFIVCIFVPVISFSLLSVLIDDICNYYRELKRRTR